jgi:hypothetical protein
MTTPTLPDVFARKARAPYPEYVNRVHRIGHPCVLYGWFCRVRWELRQPANDVLLRIFEEGHRWHRRVAEAFAAKDVEYVRQEEPMHWPDLQLSGHMDGIVLPCDAVPELQPGESAVIDVKGASDYAFDSIDTLDDLRNSKHWYHQAYVIQPALYAVHPQVNASWCVIYFVKRSTAETKQIWWRPEDVVDRIAQARSACRRINEEITRGDKDDQGQPLAPAHLSSPGSWCDRCDFQPACPDYVLQEQGITIAPDHIVELVAKRQTLVAGYREYNEVNDALKQFWKQAGPGTLVCGDYVVTIKETAEKEITAKPAYTRPAYVRATVRPIGQGGTDG